MFCFYSPFGKGSEKGEQGEDLELLIKARLLLPCINISGSSKAKPTLKPLAKSGRLPHLNIQDSIS